jgi:PKD repeat protein
MIQNKIITLLTIALTFLLKICFSQDQPVYPSLISTGTFLGETPPLRDLPAITQDEWDQMALQAEDEERNPELRYRSFPYAATALPKGPDPSWQRSMGTNKSGSRAPIVNFQAQTSPYYPPDANGTVGPNHYMQTINTTYAIYNKAGGLVAGPSNLNTLFNGVTGSSCNDGDPIVLYDEQADRWFVAEFSICGSNDYMLMAVSTTNDPTGSWYAYSFDVADMPDYEKFGIWQDGYYMGTNNSSGNDIYVFQRSQMLTGGTAQMVGFDNPNRPTTIDGFVCVPPVDNDGSFAPAGSPGVFIAFNDDAIGGGSDQLWIYELAVNWTTPGSSTFSRTQQINVNAFDSNFGTDWDNISQLGTTRQLDAIPQVIMNVPQYRNFGTYQTLVCCHTVDVDNTDHAGVRWYELRKTSGTWSIRQQGTYAPDSHSRWMGSIMLNGSGELGLAYSVSSSTIYPGIRYCGQSASAYAAATGTMDVTEEVIQDGLGSQTGYNRWGDYSCLQVDPADNETFWFTTEYLSSGGSRYTRVASFQIGPVALTANFSANNLTPVPNTAVQFTDLSTGGPTSWSWSFTPSTVTYQNGTTSASQHPQVSFNISGYYTVSLTVSNGTTNNTLSRTNYIHAYTAGLWLGITSTDWNTTSNWDGGIVPTSSTNVTISPTATNWPAFSGGFTLGSQCNNLIFNSSTQMNVTGAFTINNGKILDMTAGGLLNITGTWTNNGSFTAGAGTVRFSGSGTVQVTTTVSTGNIPEYAVQTFTKGMTALTGATAGPTGDDGNVDIPIGFTFSYGGVSYTSLKLSTNGWISLNQTGTLGYDNAALFTTTAPNVTIAPWWDDLYDDATSTVSYKTEGTTPNRLFTAEWYRVLSYYTGATARVSFQVKLFETSNIIEFHYGTVESGTHYSSEGASIGMEDATGGSGHFKEATTGSSTTAITNLLSQSNWPAINYRILPPSTIQTFNNITIDNPGGTVNFTVDTDVNDNFNVMPGGSFRVSSGKILNVKGTVVK